jgi:uncharacterized protein YbjT (DUF2867 family)
VANECDVFVTGGTGYMGSRLISTLVGARESDKRLGLVTLDQMVRALVAAVENPPPNGRVQIVDVAGIGGARLD